MWVPPKEEDAGMGGAACPGRHCYARRPTPPKETEAGAAFLAWKRPQEGYSINISITWLV